MRNSRRGTSLAAFVAASLAVGSAAVAHEVAVEDGEMTHGKHALHDAHGDDAEGHIAQDVNYGFREVGHDTLGGVSDGRYTDVWADGRGYAYVGANERGHFFSEGSYDILGPPLTDGVDEIEWIASQPWSNGKVGLIGCSSTAEWQMAVAAQAPRGLGTIVPQGYGAGVGNYMAYGEYPTVVLGRWLQAQLGEDRVDVLLDGSLG